MSNLRPALSEAASQLGGAAQGLFSLSSLLAMRLGAGD